jgi:hypothetical protein
MPMGDIIRLKTETSFTNNLNPRLKVVVLIALSFPFSIDLILFFCPLPRTAEFYIFVTEYTSNVSFGKL